MKKVGMCVLLVGLMVLGAQQGWSQGKKANLSLNLGVQTDVLPDSSFDWLDLSLDFRAGFALGKNFEISPELMALIDSDFRLTWVELSPGVILNYRFGKFFIGGGAILPIWFASGDLDAGNIMPKINVGYDFGRFRLTGYFLSSTGSGAGFLKYNYIGATLGYIF